MCIFGKIPCSKEFGCDLAEMRWDEGGERRQPGRSAANVSIQEFRLHDTKRQNACSTSSAPCNTESGVPGIRAITGRHTCRSTPNLKVPQLCNSVDLQLSVTLHTLAQTSCDCARIYARCPRPSFQLWNLGTHVVRLRFLRAVVLGLGVWMRAKTSATTLVYYEQHTASQRPANSWRRDIESLCRVTLCHCPNRYFTERRFLFALSTIRPRMTPLIIIIPTSLTAILSTFWPTSERSERVESANRAKRARKSEEVVESMERDVGERRKLRSGVGNPASWLPEASQ